MVDGGLISGVFFNFSSVFVGKGGFGASPVRTSVASFPAVFFFVFMTLWRTNIIFYDFPTTFLQNGLNLSSNRGTTYKTCILDPIEFWWVA